MNRGENKRIINDKPRLSLPVSIKKPNFSNSVLGQIQNMVSNAKPSVPLNTQNISSIDKIIRGRFVYKKISEVVDCTPKENSLTKPNQLPKVEPKLESSESNTHVEKVDKPLYILSKLVYLNFMLIINLIFRLME